MVETVSSVERSYAILHALKELDGARVEEVSRALDTPQSTVHKHLATLEGLGYVTNDGGVYRVGLRYLNLGGFARSNREGYEQAIGIVDTIAAKTGERTQFVVEEHGRGVYLHTTAPEQAVQTERHMGKLRYLHSSAAGKAILASLPPAYVDEIVDEHGLPAETENTITDREALYDELDRIRERGVAFNYEESIEGLRAAGVAVELPDSRVLGSFSISGPARRLKGEFYQQELPDILLGHANELELKLAY